MEHDLANLRHVDNCVQCAVKVVLRGMGVHSASWRAIRNELPEHLREPFRLASLDLSVSLHDF